MNHSPEDLCKIAAALVAIRVSSNPIWKAAQALLDAEQGLKTMRDYRDGCNKVCEGPWRRINNISNPESYDPATLATYLEEAARAYHTYHEAKKSCFAARDKYDAACKALEALLVSPEERAELRRAASAKAVPVKTAPEKGSNDE